MERGPGIWQQRFMFAGGIAVALAGVGAGMAITIRVLAYGDVKADAAAAAAPSPTSSPSAATATPTNPPTDTPQATQEPAPTATPSPAEAPSPTPTATPTPSPLPSGLVLSRSSFSFPGDATPNGGARIGPFQGGGRTITITDTAGNAVAYAYWFRWAGQAYDASRGGVTDSMYPDVRIIVADANGEESVIAFTGLGTTTGTSGTAIAGRFNFTVTFTNAVQATFNGGTYVWGSDLAASFTVAVR